MSGTVLAVLLASTANVATTEVYRCPQADGGFSLQDRPCVDHPEVNPRTLTAPEGIAPKLPIDAEPTVQPDQRDNEPFEPPPQRKLELWRCIDFEGNTRIAEHDDPRGRYVPLWVVGADPRAAPGMFTNVGRPRPQPPRAAPAAPTAAPAAQPMVWVEDRCEALSPIESCKALRKQRDEFSRRLYSAPPADRAALQMHLQKAREELRRECG